MDLTASDIARLGIMNADGSVRRLKKQHDLSECATALCLLLKDDNGKIVGHYPLRRLVDALDSETTAPTSGVSKNAREKRRRRAAKVVMLKRRPGLGFEDLELCDYIAECYYPNSLNFKPDCAQNADQGTLNIVLDECIRPAMAEYFSTDRTRTTHVISMGLKAHKDKHILLSEGHHIIATEDMDFVDLVSAVYVDRIQKTQRTAADLSDLPFILYVEQPNSRKRALQYDRNEEGLERSCKSVRRDENRNRQTKQSFNKQAKKIEQLRHFSAHLNKILRHAKDPLRPYLAATLRCDGGITFLPRSEVFDNNFVIPPKDMVKESSPTIDIDGRSRIMRPNIRNASLRTVFRKAGLTDAERDELIAKNSGILTARKYQGPRPKRRHGSRSSLRRA